MSDILDLYCLMSVGASTISDDGSKGKSYFNVNNVVNAFGKMSKDAQSYIAYRYDLTSSAKNNIEQVVSANVWDVFVSHNWLIRPSYTKGLTKIFLSETIKAGACSTCNGDKQYNKFGDVQPCNRCNGTGASSLSNKECGLLMGMSGEAYRKQWRANYEDKVSVLAGDWERDARRCMRNELIDYDCISGEQLSYEISEILRKINKVK